MTDDDLRAHLRRADPGASLPQLPPDRIAPLLEHTMAVPFAEATVTPITTSARRRRVAMLAAAAVVLFGVAAGWALLRPSPGPESTAGVPVVPLPAISSASVTRLTATGMVAKCMEPTAELLRSRTDFAFAGTVQEIDGGVVTLAVTHVYLGTPVDLVQVAQEGGASETMLGSGKFEQGGKYLVAASEGAIRICGYSGEADAPGLQALYDAAF
ncbi:hypothetical protein [Actinoplanes awajinensis]|uniref:Uncharacterized protein n=1 Tax=Actinoplanes awajinensis subsp. mycoplanecinus TaxID=135947 RepID=A0A0X3URL9_9ACTN|nr:hypothetical protein [Actinoplanes awajinensis]KUL35239.1 hypothetical protein ADL15_14530 [Actinoplanes awajinensis subsp. mycoplanecinus]